jgi:hypothetical protein
MLPSFVSDYHNSYHYAHYPNVYTAPRAPPGVLESMDGNLDKPCWRNVTWSEAFDDIQGPDDDAASTGDAAQRPTQKTRMKMMWDDDYLYIGALLEREPNLPTPATFTDRNSPIYQQDSDFEVFIDVAGSCHGYKEFEVNAINTVWNLMLDKPYRDGGHEHSGRIAKEGENDYYEVHQQKSSTRVIQGNLNDPTQGATWSVEIAMAFQDVMAHLPKSIKPPIPGSQWRINFSRVEKRGELNWTWQPQIVWDAELHRYRGYVDMHLPDAWGYLVFGDASSGLTPKKDPTWPLRMAAMTLYYAQHEYKKRTGIFAERVEQIVDLMDQAAVLSFHVEIMLEADSFEVTVREMTCGWSVTVAEDRLISVNLT